MTGTAPAGVAVLTVCAAALILIARAWPGPDGAHRRAGSGGETTVEVPFAAFMPPWSPRHEPEWPEPVHGAAVPQAFGFCPPCRRETAGVVSRDGWRCGECHLPTAVAA